MIKAVGEVFYVEESSGVLKVKNVNFYKIKTTP